MSFLAIDLLGYTLATLAALVLIVMPGFGLHALMRRFAKVDLPASAGLVLGLALLPAVDALVVRWVGLAPMLVLHLTLALLGAVPTLAMLRTTPRYLYAVAGGWWLLVAWANVDVETASGLHQSLTVLDLVKHAAVIRAIADHGLPLVDPFVARDQAAGYYYYFYIGPALIDWLGGRVIEARAAFMAASFVAGIGFVSVMLLLAERANMMAEPYRFTVVLIALCFVSGVDILPNVLTSIMTGVVSPQLDWWGDAISWVSNSIPWVPHHLSAVMSVFLASIIIECDRTGASSRTSLLMVAAAGCALASAFGMSVWIALAAVPVLGGWWIAEIGRTDAPRWWALPLAGCIALVLTAPQIADLVQGRQETTIPMQLHLRNFASGPEFWWPMRTALLPVGYAIDFGIFALGSIVYFASGGWRQARATPIGRLLIVSAATAFIVVSLVQSTIIYNDFGWRAIWFAQMPAMLWTANACCAGLSGETRRIGLVALGLGLCAATYDFVGMRFVRPPWFPTTKHYINRSPVVDRDLRKLYEALSTDYPPNGIAQHNPVAQFRATAFGLYGGQRVYVADVQAQLFGATRQEVTRRIDAVAPIFALATPLAVRIRTALVLKIDVLVVTRLDPAWLQLSPLCRWRLANACAIDVNKLR